MPTGCGGEHFCYGEQTFKFEIFIQTETYHDYIFILSRRTVTALKNKFNWKWIPNNTFTFDHDRWKNMQQQPYDAFKPQSLM